MGSNKGTSCHIQIKGEGKSRVEEIDLFPFVIGRGEDADIKILASGISRLHISVSLKEGSLWIEDLGSANGTFLNDKKLSPKTPAICRPGDAIRLGLNNDILTFSLIEEKGPEHHEVVLPPLPKHIPEAKEPLRVEVKVPAKPRQVAEEIKPLEGTIVDPNYQSAALAAAAAKKAASAAASMAASVAVSKEQLEEAKAAALRIKITAETEAAKILQTAKEMGHDELSKAREEATQVVSKATDQAYRLQREGEAEATKMRQAMQDTISKVHAETEEKVETTLKEARLSATTIKATAQTEADGIISKAYQKALETKEKGEEELKSHQKIEKKKGSEIVERAQKEADKILEEAHGASIKIRENIDKEIEAIKARVEKEALKNSDDLVKTATTEAERIKKEALKTAQKISDEVLRSERASHLATFEKENKNLAETLLAAQTSLKELEEEKGRLHDYIDEHKKKEAELTKDFEERKTKLTKEHDGFRSKLIKESDELKSKVSKVNDESQTILAQEHEHFKAQLVKERDEFKSQIDKEKNKMASLVAEEEKVLREKAKAEFYLQRENLEAEFAKSRISEISKALETYIIPRIKEGLNWDEIPKSLGNFSGDLRDIVKKVMNGDYSETVADTAMDTSLNHNTSSRRAKTLLFMTLGGGTAVLAFMAYTSLQDPASVLRKPASEIFSKFQKPVPAPLVTSLEYKGSYTDNILYTKDYVSLKLNPKDHEVWKTEIDNFFTNNLGLEKSKAEKFADMEFLLVHQLAGVRSGIKAENKKESIQKMATLEKLSVDQFIDVLGSQANYNAFRDFEKNYIERNRTPANQN